MNQYYQPWYMKRGIRTAGHLIAPPLSNLESLDLPKQSIYHYIPESPLDTGPSVDEFIFRNINRPIMMGHIVENGDNKGNPRHLAISAESLIRSYHIKHRRYRLMRSLESASRDSNTLIVYNYGFIPKLYRYMRSYYTDYYKWINLNAAVWKNIGKLATENERNQFITCKLPLILPSIPDLRLASKTISQKTVKLFNTPESLTILELWKWFGEERKESLLANVPEEHLDKVNIIFQESGKWFVMNLGRMNRWRIATKEELEVNPEANTKGIDPQQLQKRFLRLMMALFQVRTVASTDVVEIDGKKIETKNKEEPNLIVKKEATIPVLDKDTDVITTKESTVNVPGETLDETVNEEEQYDETISHNDEIEKQLAIDLEELERISIAHNGNMDEEGNKVKETVVIKDITTLEDGVMTKCDRLAEVGLLSAAEYKRYEKLSKSYRSIISPNGKDTLDKFIVIKPETLALESTKIKDISTVTDKTMLKSSLLDFDKKYIKEVMQKDIAGMVLNVQNAGIAVTGYEVEHVDTVLGSHDMYSVSITPVEGTPSTLRFKLPSVDEDGVYVSNGTRYRIRKLKGDLPIRKVAPDSVALTSYYGKTFVNRNSKKTNNYGQWLTNSIMSKGLDNSDTVVTNLQVNNVFDNLFKAPRIYSILAMTFRSFTVNSPFDNNSYSLMFDHNKREELYGKDILSTYEKDESIVIGKNISKDIYLVLDKHGTIYRGIKGVITDLCTIEELLDLEADKAPVDFAELRIMGEPVPIGIVLGYEMGLDKLMSILNVEPRRVHAGTRVNLEPHEYSIVFSDETLIFSRDDKKASMILAGFNNFHKMLREYSVYEFDKRGVYLNIIESYNLSVRYLREIDLMYQMFIDPITKDILISMKEPTTFNGLLIRSCEMLLNDQHPEELDPAYMRIKGYERMAGAVYTEIVKAIRAHNGRNGKSRYPIELNPFAVWMSIRQDPSVALVSDINPIQNLKEVEAVTFSGTGGRNTRSMVKNTRIYHKNDMGTISESTVDSGDVAINVFTSADPQFNSLRGTSNRYEIGKTGATALLSTSALNAPCSDVDD